MKKVFWINSIIIAVIVLLLATECKKEELTTITKSITDSNSGSGIDSLPASFPIVFNPNLEYGTVTDIEGNVYKTIQIGSQTWMAENLRTTHYSDGSPIPLITSDSIWAALTFNDKAYCWFNNDSASNARPYGALYTWPAAMNGVCPDGWHLPSDREWTILTNYLGGLDVAVNKMMETGSKHWQNPNALATNESGFTALPGGTRSFDAGWLNVAVWWNLCEIGYWWSSTEKDYFSSWHRYIISSTYTAKMDRIGFKNQGGLSVRCLKGDPDRVPTGTTLGVTDIFAYGATLNGTVNGYGLPTIVTFEYGTSTDYGLEVTAEQSPVSGDTLTNICAALTGLTEITYYHFRVKAENSAGTFYGDDIVFAPLCNNAPIVSKLEATNISSSGATLNGTLNANGFPTTVTFLLRYFFAKGGYRYEAVQPSVTITGNSITNVSVNITRYWGHGGIATPVRIFRIKATNICGTTLSDTCDFRSHNIPAKGNNTP